MTREQILNAAYSTEDQMSAYFYRYVNEQYPKLRGVFFHVPNGGTRNAKEGMKLKAMGVMPGMCDYICLSPLFAIELKMPNGKISTEQKRIHTILQAANIALCVAFTMEQAVTFLEQQCDNL